MKQGKKFKVEGVVQGVFFRKYTQEKARELGLSGWVRNCSDASVEVLAFGSDQDLMALEKWLWQGSPQSIVNHVHSKITQGSPNGDFRILQSL